MQSCNVCVWVFVSAFWESAITKVIFLQIITQSQVSAPLNSQPVIGYRKGGATPIWSPAWSGGYVRCVICDLHMWVMYKIALFFNCSYICELAAIKIEAWVLSHLSLPCFPREWLVWSVALYCHFWLSSVGISKMTVLRMYKYTSFRSKLLDSFRHIRTSDRELLVGCCI